VLSELDKAIAQFMQEQQDLQSMPPGNMRCYHDHQGSITHIVFGPPWPNTDQRFVDLTKEQADQITLRDRVVNGQVIFVDQAAGSVLKLVECESGEHVTVAGHMAIVLDSWETYQDVRTFTQNIDRRS
jgi:hypothetical protein